jgi:hypothetical protein
VLLAATGLDALARVGPRARIAALGTTAALLVLATAGTLAFVDPGRLGSEAFEPAWSTRVLGRFVALTQHEDGAALCGFVRRAGEERPPEVSEELCFTIGRTLKDALLDARRREQAGEPTPLSPVQVSEALAALRGCAPADVRPYFEEPWAGERPCTWSERSRFWRQWERREAERLNSAAPR